MARSLIPSRRPHLAVAAVLLCLAQALSALAQVTASPRAPAGQRPLIDAAANGVPIVHIAPPSPAGVSRNDYREFNVPERGLILNNSPGAVQTEQGGWISGNLQLGRVPARIILNEITGTQPSQLLGTIEVAGHRADLVIANPNGITCNGCGFLNTAGRTTLLGGRTLSGPDGSVHSLDATADLHVGPRGLDAAAQQQLDLVARGLVIEGEVWAHNLQAVIGSNRVLHADLRGPLQHLPGSTSNGEGRFAIDIRELGGMYAHQIYLVATDQGLGVNSSGRLAALQGNLVISSAGELSLRDAHASQDMRLAAQGQADLSGARVTAGRSVQVRSQGLRTAQAQVVAPRIDLDAGSGPLANAGGQVQAVGADSASLRVVSAGVDNRGGELFSAGTLAIDAGGGHLDNTGGVVSATHSTLEQVGGLTNRGGQLFIDNDLHLSGPLDNAQGLIDSTASLDIDASGQSLDNQGGRIVARGDLHLRAGTLANADGLLAAGQRLGVRIGGDYTHSGSFSTGTDLFIATAGRFTNSGVLNAPRDLRIAATDLINPEAAGIVSQSTTLEVAGHLDNQGLVDSTGGTTRITATTLHNTGRIYGDSVALAGDVRNTADSQGRGAVIGAREGTLSVRGNLENTDGSLVLSLGDIALDGDVTNRGATINASGSIRIEGRLHNLNADLATTTRQTTETLNDVYIIPAGSTTRYRLSELRWLDSAGGRYVLPSEAYPFAEFGYEPVIRVNEVQCSGSGGDEACSHTPRYGRDDPVWQRFRVTPPPPAPPLPEGRVSCEIAGSGENGYPTRDVAGACGPYWQQVDAVEQVTLAADSELDAALVRFATDLSYRRIVDWFEVQATERQVQTTEVTGSQPGQVLAGGSITLNGGVNQDSVIVAGTTLSGSIDNLASSGERRTTDEGRMRFSHREWHGGVRERFSRTLSDWQPYTSGTEVYSLPLGVLRHEIGAAVPPQALSVPALAEAAVPGTTRVDAPLRFPGNALFSVPADPGARYLVETDPAFTQYQRFISSDAMLAHLGMDPERTLRRYGDGFAEQRLIDDQVLALTGRRYLAGYRSTEEEYAALMEAGAEFARQYQLTPGIALTAEQMAALTTDIVWLETRTVVLPDGSSAEALVPRVYLRRPAEGDIRPNGALLSASDIHLRQPHGDLTNSGTVYAHGGARPGGRGRLLLEADNLRNSGTIAGHQVVLVAGEDVIQDGGLVTGLGADSVVEVAAGRHIVMRTTTQASQQTLAGANGQTTVSRSNIDRVATVQAGRVDLVAYGDIDLQGARVIADADLGVAAAGDIRTSTVQEGYRVDIPLGGQRLDRTGHYRAEGTAHAGTQLLAGGDARVAAGGSLVAVGSHIEAGGQLDIDASSVRIEAAVGSHSVDQQGITRFGYERTARSDEALSGGSLRAGGDLTVTTRNDLSARGASISSQEGQVSLLAGGDITLGAMDTAHSTERESHTHRRNTLSSHTRQSASAEQVVLPEGTVVSGNTVLLEAGNVTVTGSSVAAEHDLRITASGDVTIESATGTHSRQHSHQERHSGLGAMGGASLGTSRTADSASETRQTASASTVGSLQGNVDIRAGGAYRQRGSDVVAPQGDISITAQSGSVTEARETTSAQSEFHSQQSGLSLTLSNPVAGNLQQADQTLRTADRTDDPRAQALAGATAGLNLLDTSRALDAPDAGQIRIAVTLGRSRTDSQSTREADTAVGSRVAAGGDLHISIAGAGSDSDLVVRGGDLRAGGQASLRVEGDLILDAAQSRNEQQSETSSRSASIGVSAVLVGPGAGVRVDASANRSESHADGVEVTHTLTHVTAGERVVVQVGGDASLRGGVVTAPTVQAQVGGNLHIESVQDTRRHDSESSSSGVNVSLCIPPLCTGPSTASVSRSQAQAEGEFASVTEAAGIQAGDGGFQVQVGGHTHLQGGVIASTQAAVDSGSNRFTTGTLSHADIHNSDRYQAEGFGIHLAANGLAGEQGPPASQTPQRPGASAGLGSASGSQDSTTHSGISGGELTLAGQAVPREPDGTGGADTLRRDITTGQEGSGALTSSWDAQALLRDVEAQAQVLAAFGAAATEEVGRYADTRYHELRDTDPAEAANWAEGGAYRVALHTGIGALAGGLEGAGGAGLSAAGVVAIAELVDRLDLPPAVRDGLVAVGGAALGALTGGTEGATAGFNQTVNNYLRREEIERLLVVTEACQRGNAQACKERDALQALSNQRDQQLRACAGHNTPVCERLRQDVRNAQADIIRHGLRSPDALRLIESQRTQAMADGTMGIPDRLVGAVHGLGGGIVEGFVGLARGFTTMTLALFGNSAARADIRQAFDNLARLSDPQVLAEFLNALDAGQRERLAQAYEQGDPYVLGMVAGQLFAELPMLPGGPIRVVGRGVRTAEELAVGRALRTVDDAPPASSAAQGALLRRDLAERADVQPDTRLDADYRARIDANPVEGYTFDMNHVLSGEINPRGRATGYHAESAAGGSARIRPGAEIIRNSDGTYSAPIQIWDPNRGVWVDKINRSGELQRSTFFPPSWSDARIEYEGGEAFRHRTMIGPNKWEGTTPSGLRIEGYINNGQVNFFPVGKKL